jgi:hypothetical protein
VNDGQLHGRVFVPDVTLAVTGSYESLSALSRHTLDSATLENRVFRVSDAPVAAQPLQDTSYLVKQQHVHVPQRSAEQAAAAATAANLLSWRLYDRTRSHELQLLGSRRRLSQSLWDVVGSLLQQAQQQVQQAHSTRQLATESNSFEQQLWDMPGDPTAGELVLQSGEPLLGWPTFNAPQRTQQQPGGTSAANSNSVRSRTRQGTGAAKLELQITFAAVGGVSTSLRLPLPPRMFSVVVETVNEPDSRVTCVSDLVYKDQVVTCPGLEHVTEYNVSLVDQRGYSSIFAAVFDCAAAW